jgi:glycosyltransferase involved in cell wall biosynthesis
MGPQDLECRGCSVAMMSGISVIMPTYNRAHFIGQALDSLGQQGFPPAEIIVVDDVSTDDTAERVTRHPLAPRIRYHRQNTNQGASVARNHGVELARYDLIVFLDSDDVLEPEHHQTAQALLRDRSDVALFCCDSRMVGPDGEWLHDQRTWTQIQCDIKGTRISTGLRSLEELFRFSTPFPGFTIRKDVYVRVGGLDQGVFPLDDYDLQLRVAAEGYGVHYEHRPLARYRVHGSNESGPGRAVRVGRQKLRCLEEARDRYPALRALPDRGRGRIGEARRELALSLLASRQLGEGTTALGRSLLEDPGGLAELGRIVRRKVRNFALAG